jgi:hypothetical protein
MALFTIRSETGSAMIDGDGAVIVTEMARCAIARRPCKFQIRMTALAGNAPVLPDEPERCPRVIEFHRIGQLRPAFGCVAVRARLVELAVGRWLRLCNCRPERPEENDRDAFPHFHSLFE